MLVPSVIVRLDKAYAKNGGLFASIVTLKLMFQHLMSQTSIMTSYLPALSYIFGMNCILLLLKKMHSGPTIFKYVTF